MIISSAAACIPFSSEHDLYSHIHSLPVKLLNTSPLERTATKLYHHRQWYPTGYCRNWLPQTPTRTFPIVKLATLLLTKTLGTRVKLRLQLSTRTRLNRLEWVFCPLMVSAALDRPGVNLAFNQTFTSSAARVPVPQPKSV